jgi:hypothetical protein
MSGKFLTQAEVNDLPEGATVEVWWDGGGHPCVYVIGKRVFHVWIDDPQSAQLFLSGDYEFLGRAWRRINGTPLEFYQMKANRLSYTTFLRPDGTRKVCDYIGFVGERKPRNVVRLLKLPEKETP